MSKNRIHYSDTVELKCTDNGNITTAEILNFHPGKNLSCSVNRQVKVSLQYKNSQKLYIGKVGNLEFTTTGPESYITKEGR